ncbi:RidA family protein [Pseudarthrobacter sp. H2]|uniref:RidA family protein n=1 Tax=Pseudarthrobacter sp. H2 TaxID=3418415 RepID=UPI003CF7110E
MKKEIQTPLAPVPVGPYSQAVRVGPFIYLAGQGGFTAARELVAEDVGAQTKQAFTNLINVLEAGGGSLKDLVSVRVYLSDDSEFAGMNDAYAQFFEAPFPVRTTVSAGLGPGMKVEIDAVAIIDA